MTRWPEAIGTDPEENGTISPSPAMEGDVNDDWHLSTRVLSLSELPCPSAVEAGHLGGSGGTTRADKDLSFPPLNQGAMEPKKIRRSTGVLFSLALCRRLLQYICSRASSKTRCERLGPRAERLCLAGAVGLVANRGIDSVTLRLCMETVQK